MPLNRVSVASVIGDKSSSLFTISVKSSADKAVAEMNRHRIGSIVVKNERDCVGIFTERDVLTRIVASGRNPKNTPLSEVMTADFKRIDAEASVEDAMQMMTNLRVRHLPVFEGSKLVGMISIGDVTRWLLKFNKMEAENLRSYVLAEYPA